MVRIQSSILWCVYIQNMFKAEYHGVDSYKTCLKQYTMVWIHTKHVFKAVYHGVYSYKTCLKQNTMVCMHTKHV